MPLTQADFDYVADLARKNAAIVLDPGKEYLVESRLTPIARTEGFDSLSDFIGRLRGELGYGSIHARVIDALTTNETYFFRDIHPFDALRNDILPGLIARRSKEKSLVLWCGAASTGQEPYSFAMMLREYFPQLNDWKITIVATDISPRVLEQARKGEYNQIEVNRGLPALLLVKYFQKQGDRWVIKEAIRKMVEFKRMNLIEPWPALPTCDIVLMRNVLIYFDTPTKQTIMRNVRRFLAPDGYFFLGTAETTMNIDPVFLPMSYGKATIYRTQLNPR